MIKYGVSIKYENNAISISAEMIEHDNTNDIEIQIAEALDTEVEGWVKRMQDVAQLLKANKERV